jgi:hypothetical protein
MNIPTSLRNNIFLQSMYRICTDMPALLVYGHARIIIAPGEAFSSIVCCHHAGRHALVLLLTSLLESDLSRFVGNW